MIRISLVIPTHNRAAQLIAALESVVRQNLPPHVWECVVVNNNSTDNTVMRFGNFAETHPGITLRLVTEEGPGVSYARNRGLQEARAPTCSLRECASPQTGTITWVRAPSVAFFAARPMVTRLGAWSGSGVDGYDMIPSL